jgi:hypothetical protein
MPLLALSCLIVFFVFLKNGKLLRLFHHLSTGKYKQAYDTIHNKAREIVLVFRRARQGFVSTLEVLKSLVLLIIHPEYGVISPPKVSSIVKVAHPWQRLTSRKSAKGGGEKCGFV